MSGAADILTAASDVERTQGEQMETEQPVAAHVSHREPAPAKVKRRTLCQQCGIEPRRDGSRFCSDACDHDAAEAQAFSM